MISFSKERAHLTDHYLYVDDIPVEQRPLSGLLKDHLSLGVSLHCLPPTSQNWGNSLISGLLPVLEGLSLPYSGVDSEEGDFEDPMITGLGDVLSGLSLRGGKNAQRQTDALDQLRQFGAKGMVDGEGKLAFENYLAMALG